MKKIKKGKNKPVRSRRISRTTAKPVKRVYGNGHGNYDGDTVVHSEDQ